MLLITVIIGCSWNIRREVAGKSVIYDLLYYIINFSAYIVYQVYDLQVIGVGKVFSVQHGNQT